MKNQYINIFYSYRAFPFQGGPGAFTLVELIVVVTILALLSTIGFVSYSSYLSGVRDTNRLSQLVAISDGLELYRTKKTLPIPDDNIEIRANGTVIGYQGYAGVNVLETIDYSKTGKDPKDKIHFSYYLTQDKKYYQLLTYLEEEENLETNNNLFQKTYADTDYTNRYPKVSGKKIGILTQSGTNIPVQEVTALISSGYLDIATTTDSYVARLTDEKNISGNGTNLVSTLPSASCNRIKQMGKSTGDGEYKINPTGTGTIKVYCDMSTDGGGWTSIVRFNPSENDSLYWTNPKIEGDFYNHLDKKDIFNIKEIYVNKVIGWDGGESYFEKVGNDLYARRGILKDVKMKSNWGGLGSHSRPLSDWIGFSHGNTPNGFFHNSVEYVYAGHNNTNPADLRHDFPFYNPSIAYFSDNPWGGTNYEDNVIVNIFIR